MTWFEAYVLWKLDDVMIVITVVWFVVLCMAITSWGVTIFSNEWREDRAKKIKSATAWLTLMFILTSVVCMTVPNSTQLLKIIATKKGVDAIQSDTAAKYLGEVDKTITNGLKVLNQEIEKKLDKKGGEGRGR